MFDLTANVDWEDGQDNTAGIQQKIAIALLRDIATLPGPEVENPLALGSASYSKLVTVSSNIVMNAYKKFIECYCTKEAGELKTELQGERDGKSFKSTLEVFMPGSKADFFGFVKLIKNSNLVAIIPDMDGQKYLLGDRKFGLQLASFTWGTGKAAADRKGGTLTFDFNGNVPFYLFTGKIDLVGSGFESGQANDFQTLFSA